MVIRALEYVRGETTLASGAISATVTTSFPQTSARRTLCGCFLHKIRRLLEVVISAVPALYKILPRVIT